MRRGFIPTIPGSTGRDLVAQLIRDSGAAIVGVQEMLPAMKEDMRQRLADYSVFGWGRTKKMADEHSAILVHNPEFGAVSDTTIWLSKHPEKRGSRAYFAMFPRICTICEMYSKEAGRKIGCSTPILITSAARPHSRRADYPRVYAPLQRP